MPDDVSKTAQPIDPASYQVLLRQRFGLDSFRQGQREAIDHVLHGHNTLVVMPTGSGKSLIYQFSALAMPDTALVISPLIALMKDQVDRLQSRGIAATFINSSLTGEEQARRMTQLAAGHWNLDIRCAGTPAEPGFSECIAQSKSLTAGRGRGALHLTMGT